jgi:putative transposase
VHWDIQLQMTEADIEIIIQVGCEKYLDVRPRIISDNGPQFIAKDFKEFIRVMEMTHVRTSPYYPQSNGKIERWNATLKSECIRVQTPLSIEDAKRVVSSYVEHYNSVRLHSAIGYITPKDKLEGRAEEIFKSRDQKLEQARAERAVARQKKYESGVKAGAMMVLVYSIHYCQGTKNPFPAEPTHLKILLRECLAQ